MINNMWNIHAYDCVINKLEMSRTFGPALIERIGNISEKHGFQVSLFQTVFFNSRTWPTTS